MDQWTDGPMDQWTKGPMDQWINGPTDQWTHGPIEHWNILTLEHHNIETLKHWNIGIGTFNTQSAYCDINCIDTAYVTKSDTCNIIERLECSKSEKVAGCIYSRPSSL